MHELEPLQAFAQRYASAIHIHNFGHSFAARGPGLKLEPDICAGQVVAMQIFGNLDPLAKPDRVVGVLAARLGDGPRGIIEIRALAVRQIAGVYPPFAVGNAIQLSETRNDLLCRRRQGLGGDLLSRLGPHRSRKQKTNCRNSATNFFHLGAIPSDRCAQRRPHESRLSATACPHGKFPRTGMREFMVELLVVSIVLEVRRIMFSRVVEAADSRLSPLPTDSPWPHEPNPADSPTPRKT